MLTVLCKKPYGKYIKLNWYEVDVNQHTFFDNGIVDSYFIISRRIDDECFYGRRFKLDNWSINNHHHPKFSEYFYTPKEIRKLKLQKLKSGI
jgi:hypothetical protein